MHLHPHSMTERAPRPARRPGEGGVDDEGPRRPKVERPGTDDLVERMRRVDPHQARRYRQRTGQ